MKYARNIFSAFFGVLVLAAFSGCGDPAVSGKVTFNDGTPLTIGMVVLQNNQSQGIGELKQDGSFKIYQYKPGDGLKKGAYRGYISNAVESDDQGRLTSLIPEKYADIDQAGIEYDTEKNNGHLEIVIEKPTPKRRR